MSQEYVTIKDSVAMPTNELTESQKELVQELIELEIDEEFFGFRANEIKKELGL